MLQKKYNNSLVVDFTTREGGISPIPFNSLNLAFHVNDQDSNVLQNHIIVANKHSYSYKKLVYMQQIHSDKVYIVTKKDSFFTPPTADALITNCKNIPLMVMVADCTPVLFYDPKQEVIAVAHVGRAGAFKNIIKNVLDYFIQVYGSQKKDIIVESGASICQNCYEVSATIFQEAQTLQLDYALKKKQNSFYLDIKAIITQQLLNENIKEENIKISKECSRCQDEKYFSYRASAKTGRFAGIIMLKE